MANTQIEQQQIVALSQAHDETANQIKSEVAALYGEVTDLEAVSSSYMTKALRDALDLFSNEMNQKVLPFLTGTAESMRTASNIQDQAGQDNAVQVRNNQSQLEGFLSNA